MLGKFNDVMNLKILKFSNKVKNYFLVSNGFFSSLENKIAFDREFKFERQAAINK